MCVLSHKERAPCSGERDATKYIPKRELRQSFMHFDSDYNFLTKMQDGLRKANQKGAEIGLSRVQGKKRQRGRYKQERKGSKNRQVNRDEHEKANEQGQASDKCHLNIKTNDKVRDLKEETQQRPADSILS